MIAIPAPMQAPEQLFRPFTDPDWLFELKFDGYRCMAGIEPPNSGGSASNLEARVRLLTKSGADCTKWFPEIAKALATLPGGPHVLDGEACVLRPDGTSDFNLLQERARRRRWYPGAPAVTYCAFDLLVKDGRSVVGLPLTARKRELSLLLAGLERQGILFVKDLDADAAVFQAMVQAGLEIEGVVAKRRDSRYHPGVRSDEWRKVKRPGWQEGRKWKG